MDINPSPTLTSSAPIIAGSGAVQETDAAKWEKWFQPGVDGGKSVDVPYLKMSHPSNSD